MTKPKAADRIVDFHCHLDLFPDPARAFDDNERRGCLTLTMTTTPRAWPQNQIWAEGKHHAFIALGLHPELIISNEHEAELLYRNMSGVRVIGEVGLDGSTRHRQSLPAQRRIFCKILELAAGTAGSVLSIHSRSAVTDVLRILSDVPRGSQITPVLHWFSGSEAELETALSIGCMFSVNGAMLNSERSRRLILKIPDDRLLTESDAPFRGGKSIVERDCDIARTLDNLAQLRGQDAHQIRAAVYNSAMSLLNFAPP